MFTDNPKPTILQRGCLHRGFSQSMGDASPSSFCFKLGDCEGWRVWGCKECGYIYFDQAVDMPLAPEEYDSEKNHPSFTLSEALQAYNWALKGRDDEPAIASLKDLINYYILKCGYQLKGAVDRTWAELAEIAAASPYDEKLSTKASLIRLIITHMNDYKVSREDAFRVIRTVMNAIESECKQGIVLRDE